ncbi:metalloprotease [Mucor velutinosus]|uniref:Metalloprotease n=1 Tax=Mucor velutinosus TaxID=708070 RepID=A0AAN7DAP2_9FUNG|nr:metalloprotease [Mucor velutinosus]
MTSTVAKRQKNVPVTETFYGYIETTRDSLLLFEACKRGLLPRITRRLQDKERILIRSGTIFCFDEHESGIKRWTDGFVWSPSRIMGNFLIYRELEDKKSIRSKDATFNNKHTTTARNATTGYVMAPDLLRRQQEKALVGSLKTSFKFKRNGLIKKSISLIVDGVQQHIISYYSKEDVMSSRLRTPSSLVELASLEVSPGLRLRQNFRAPAFQQQSMMEDTPATANDDGWNPVTQRRNNKRKYTEYKSSSSTSYASSNSGITSSQLEPPPSVDKASAPLCLGSKMNKRKEKSHSLLPPVIHKPPSNEGVAYIGLDSGVQSLSLDLPADLLDAPPPTSGSQVSFAPCKSTLALNQPLSTCFSNTPQSKQDNPHTTLATKSVVTNKLPHQISSNISIDKNFSNTNYTSSSSRLSSTSNDYNMTNNQMGLIASGGYYAPFKADDYYEGQNPHQHLFSSSSFHAINHASILPNRNTDITANAFMEDINVLLGTGWNEFELQM